MKKLPTFNAQIYVGLRKGYDGPVADSYKAEAVCQDYVNRVGWCVTVTNTFFMYKDGCEPGVIVGIINYPRFPRTIKELKRMTIELAKLLKKELKQNRVSIVFTDETIMLGK